MSRELRAAGLITTREIAASLGGAEDRGIGDLEPRQGHHSPRRSSARTYSCCCRQRWTRRWRNVLRCTRKFAKGRPIRAYVNVGGGSASTGPPSIDQYFEPGLITSAGPKAFAVDSVTGHFLKQGVPVLNFSGIATIASRYGLPLTPQVAQPIGGGGVYNTMGYQAVAGGVLDWPDSVP